MAASVALAITAAAAASWQIYRAQWLCVVVENIPFQHILIVKLFSFSDLLRQLPSREGAPVAPSGIQIDGASPEQSQQTTITAQAEREPYAMQ